MSEWSRGTKSQRSLCVCGEVTEPQTLNDVGVKVQEGCSLPAASQVEVLRV